MWRSLPDSAQCSLVKHGNGSVVVRLDLTGERELLTILSGRERTVRLLDELRAERGDAPDAWYDALMERARWHRCETPSPVPRASRRARSAFSTVRHSSSALKAIPRPSPRDHPRPSV